MSLIHTSLPITPFRTHFQKLLKISHTSQQFNLFRWPRFCLKKTQFPLVPQTRKLPTFPTSGRKQYGTCHKQGGTTTTNNNKCCTLRCNLLLASEKLPSRNLLEETQRLAADAVRLTADGVGWRRPWGEDRGFLRRRFDRKENPQPSSTQIGTFLKVVGFATTTSDFYGSIFFLDREEMIR